VIVNALAKVLFMVSLRFTCQGNESGA